MTQTATSPALSTSRAQVVLRRVLLADGIVGGLTAVGLLSFTSFYEQTTGLSAGLLQSAAVILFGYVAALMWAGLRHPLNQKLVAGLVVANVAWVAASLTVVGTSDPTLFGAIYVVVQAGVAAGFALAEQKLLTVVRNYQR